MPLVVTPVMSGWIIIPDTVTVLIVDVFSIDRQSSIRISGISRHVIHSVPSTHVGQVGLFKWNCSSGKINNLYLLL